MKALKILLISLGSVAVIVVLAVVILSFPAVQRSIALSLIEDEPHREAEIESVRLRWGGLEASGVVIREYGEEYRVGTLDVRFPLWDAIVRRDLRIGSLLAEEVLIDLSESRRDAVEPSEEEFEGVLRSMDLPFRLWASDIDVSGGVRLLAGTEPAGLTFSVGGGGIAPGETGAVIIHLATRPESGAMEAVYFRGEVEMEQRGSGGFNRLALMGNLSGEPESNNGLGLSVLMAQHNEEETYRVDATDRSAENDSRQILTVDAAFNAREGRFHGDWELAVETADIAGILGRELPRFDGTGAGSFSYQMETAAFDAAGSFEGNMDDPGELLPELGAVGPLHLVSRFDLGYREDQIRVDELELEAGRPGDVPYLVVRGYGPVEYDFEQQLFRTEDERLRVASARLRDVPAGWLLLAGAQEEGWSVDDGLLSGEVDAGIEGDGFFVETSEPLMVRGFAISSNGEAQLSNIDIRLRGNGFARRDVSGMRGEISEFSVSESDVELLNASGRFAEVDQEGRAEIEVNLSRLARQPLFHALEPVQAGSFRAEGGGTWRNGLQLTGEARLADVVAGPESVAVPTLSLTWEVEQTAPDTWNLSVPVEATLAGEASDLLIAGTLRTDDVLEVALSAEGNTVRVDDLLAFAEVIDQEAEEVDERDEQPFWSGVAGQVDLNIERVMLPGDQLGRELFSRLTITEATLENRIEMLLYDSEAIMTARLDFDEAAERPYQLQGRATAPGVDLGAIFRQAEPADTPPALEGLFSVVAEFEGDGRNLPELTERLRGRFNLESGGGSYRMLRSNGALNNLGLAVGGLLAARGMDVGRDIASLAETLSHIRYDDLSLSVSRDEDLNIVLQEFFMQAPELQLRGAGVVRHRQDVDLLEQPMEMRFELGARGGMERLLDALGVLEPEPDDADETQYRSLEDPFRISGSLSRPDAGDLYRTIAQRALRRAAPANDEADEAEREDDDPDEPEERTRPSLPDALEVIDDIFRRTRR